jgi:hypothetical protein
MYGRNSGRLAVAVLYVALASCSGNSTGPENNSRSGQYSVNWERSPATCAPNALPAPQGRDTTLYARLSSTSGLTFKLTMDGLDEDSVFTLTSGGNALGLTMRGAFRPRGDSALFRRNATETEGPRAGGHAFTVTEEATDSAGFVVLVLTPPGNQLSVSFFAKGSGKATFREGGPNGATYTTCNFTESISGSRPTF